MLVLSHSWGAVLSLVGYQELGGLLSRYQVPIRSLVRGADRWSLTMRIGTVYVDQ